MKRPIRNAFKINYLERSNNLYTASFSLPINDKDTNKLKNFSFVEIYDGERRIELFVIVKSSETYGGMMPTVQYELLDALFLLNMSVIEYLQLVNPTTREALEAVLSFQYVPYWQLGDNEFSRGFSYSWENENGLLNPLMSIVGDTAEPYIIERDTTRFPFLIHFRRPTTEVSARVKQGYNMQGFVVEQEGKNLVNWILPKGNAEGINAVDIARVNNNTRYLMDQESMDEYFPAMTIWKDERYTVEENLLGAAQGRLDTWKKPEVTWEVEAVDLTKVLAHENNIKANSNRKIKANELNLDSLIVVHTKKYGKLNLRILERGKSDSTAYPGELKLKITNEDYNPFSYDVKRQQEISKMTAMGAQSVIPWVFDREAEYDNPVEFQFFVFDQVENVNNAFLWINTERFRATSKGNESAPTTVTAATTGGGGAYVSTVTSQSGGSSVQSSTSSSGGGTSTSTSSGGGSTQTSSSGGGTSTSTNSGGGTSSSSTSGGLYNNIFSSMPENGTGTAHYHIIFGEHLQHSHTFSLAAHNHGFTVPNHTHNVSVPNHTHNFSTPNHTHGVTINIPAHTHDLNLSIPNHTHNVTVTIPSHTHDLIYGIFEYNSLPNELEIWIDDNKLPTTSTSINELDLRDYMRKDSSGKITRGNHTLRIRPNDLARLEIQIMLIVFIKSRIGEKL